MAGGVMAGADVEAIGALETSKRLTAAIRSDFDPYSLFETDSLLNYERADLIDGLAQLCKEVDAGSGRRHWSMRTPARRAVLQGELAHDDRRDLLGRVEVPADDRAGTYLKRALMGEDISVDLPASVRDSAGQSDLLLEANAMLRALQLARDVRYDWYAPADQRIRRFIASAEADRALAVALPPRLIGRQAELEYLGGYRRARLGTDGPWVPTCILTGPGGAGKSALVSRFVLDERNDPQAPPVVYFDFDKAAIIDASPLELTFELTRQIGYRDEELDRPLVNFRDLARDLRRGLNVADVDGGSGTEFDAYRELASILSGWEHREAAVLVVLDTFEEVAGRGSSAVLAVLQWLRSLRDEVGLTQIHAIVSGREVIPDAPHLGPGEVEGWFAAHSTRQLGDLDTGDAVELLRELGVADDLSHRLPAVFGGNPLVLKLLSRFLEGSTRAEIEDLIQGSSSGGAPVGEVGQRFVYRRLLERVRNPRVQALAYPGIALRRVTPEIVLQVLAPHMATRLDVMSIDDATQIFDELADHVWLVSRIDATTVVHRTDTRRLLVPGLERDPNVPTEAIHRSAAEYYERRPIGVSDDVAGIEAGYHRGFLGDVPEDQREAGRLLRRLGPDLEYWPIESRARLKSVAGFDEQLTEDEVLHLDDTLLFKSRAARIEQRRSKGDSLGARFEAERLASRDDLDESPERLVYLYEVGDFDYICDDLRARRLVESYLVDGVGVSGQLRTHHHPWLIAVAYRMTGRTPAQLLSDAVLEAMSGRLSQQLAQYAVAIAGLAGDETSHAAALNRMKLSYPSHVGEVDALLELQALGAVAVQGAMPVWSFRVPSAGHFRLDHLVDVADRYGSPLLNEFVSSAIAGFRAERPMTSQLNAFRQGLGDHQLAFDGVEALRSAPMIMSFAYAPLRTVASGLTALQQREVIDLLATRSIFWPLDQNGQGLVPDGDRPMSSRQLAAMIELADRCGLIVELADLLNARARTELSAAVSVGIRRVEAALFPLVGSGR